MGFNQAPLNYTVRVDGGKFFVDTSTGKKVITANNVGDLINFMRRHQKSRFSIRDLAGKNSLTFAGSAMNAPNKTFRDYSIYLTGLLKGTAPPPFAGSRRMTEGKNYDPTKVPGGPGNVPIEPPFSLEDFIAAGGLGGGGGGGYTGPTAEEIAIAREQNDIARRTALGNLIADMVGNRVNDVGSSRQANLGLYEATLPTAVSPEMAGLLGRIFGGVAGGNPMPTTPVTVNTDVFNPLDMAAEQAAAEQRSRPVLGMNKGGIITRAAGGITLNSAVDLPALFQLLVGLGSGIEGLSGVTGTIPNQLIDALNTAFGQTQGTSSKGQLVRASGDPRVFLIDNQGIAHHIADPDTFNALGFQWKDIRTVTPGFVNQLQVGDRYSAANIGQVLRSFDKPSFQREQFERTQGFAEKQAIANAASNPRRILEAVFLQNQLAVPDAIREQQDALNTIGNASVGGTKWGTAPTNPPPLASAPLPPLGGGLMTANPQLPKQLHPIAFNEGGIVTRAAKGKVVEGPVVAWIGEGPNKEGLKSGTSEVTLLMPGSVVAPWHGTKEPTEEEALAVLAGHVADSGSKHSILSMAKGGVVSAEKAKKILEDGHINGKKLTRKQKKFFGAVSGGDLVRAYDGIEAGRVAVNPDGTYPDVSDTGGEGVPSYRTKFTDPLEYLRRLMTMQLAPGIKAGMNNSFFDPLGGAASDVKGMFAQGLPRIGQINRLSGTQRGVLEALLSAGGVEPQDFFDRVQRDFSGFGPAIQSGQRARLQFR